MTSPLAKASLDVFPAVSPDGRTVAFSRMTSYELAEIYLLELTEELKPKREPRQLTSLNGFSAGSTWTPDGREIIFTSAQRGAVNTGAGSLFKVNVSDGSPPEPLSFAGDNALSPAISRSGKRLVFQRPIADANIWRLPLSGPGVAHGHATPLISSSRADQSPQYSPDGKRIVFESWRTGAHRTWICDADGSNAVELLPGAMATCGTARWSPDGQRIAFEYGVEGNLDIYVIEVTGGKPFRLTNGPGDAVSPSWSRDGKWIYFASKRTGRYEIWKVPSKGGDAVQITRNGGETAFESIDGKTICYTKDFSSSALWKMAVSGGAESEVLPSVVLRAFFPVKEGIYFIPEPELKRQCFVKFLSFAKGKVKTVASMSALPNEGLSVSPDGRFLLFSQTDLAGSELMLVENFR